MNDSLLRGPFEIELTNIQKYPHIFPKKSYLILNKLRMTDIGLYSMIVSDCANYLIKTIQDILRRYNIKIQDLNGLDLGCNIGGTLYYFLQNCNHMTGIEYEPLHVEICYHNISTLNNKLNNRLTLLYGDVEDIFMSKRIMLNNTKTYDGKFKRINLNKSNTKPLNKTNFKQLNNDNFFGFKE